MKASEIFLRASLLLGAKAKKLARQGGEPIFGKEEHEFVDFVKAHTEFFSMPRTAVEMAEIGLPLAKESPCAFAWWLKRNNIRSETRKGSRAGIQRASAAGTLVLKSLAEFSGFMAGAKHCAHFLLIKKMI